MKLVFVIGTGRCGSTLLNEILTKHQDSSYLSSFEEDHRGMLGKMSPLSGRLYRAGHLPLLKRFEHKFKPTEAYGLIRRKVSSIYVQPTKDLLASDVTPWLQNRFRSFFQERYERAGKPVLIHKYTGWSRLGFFSKIFPEAKFVHVYRDGRAVANSWLQVPWWTGYQGPDQWLWGPLNDQQKAVWEECDQSYVALAGLCWNMLMESYETSSAAFSSDNYLNVRYEDYIDDPATWSKQILEFSGLDWSSDFESQLSRFNITPARADAYRRDLSANQLAILDSITAPTLSKLGYADTSSVEQS